MEVNFADKVSLFILVGILIFHKFLQYGADGFTSATKEVMLPIFNVLKMYRPRMGLSPQT
jgi:hypothetical protein